MFDEKLSRTDLIWFLARFAVFPAILVAVFLRFGFDEFCVAALMIWLASLIYRLAIERKAHLSLSQWTIVATPALFGLTLYTGEPLYAQIFPTIYCGNTLIFGILSLWPNLPSWLKLPRISNTDTGSTTKVTLVFAFVLIGGINEIVRIFASLEIWVLLYSFFWLEIALVTGLLIAAQQLLRALMLAIANAFGR